MGKMAFDTVGPKWFQRWCRHRPLVEQKGSVQNMCLLFVCRSWVEKSVLSTRCGRTGSKGGSGTDPFLNRRVLFKTNVFFLGVGPGLKKFAFDPVGPKWFQRHFRHHTSKHMWRLKGEEGRRQTADKHRTNISDKQPDKHNTKRANRVTNTGTNRDKQEDKHTTNTGQTPDKQGAKHYTQCIWSLRLSGSLKETPPGVAGAGPSPAPMGDGEQYINSKGL